MFFSPEIDLFREEKMSETLKIHHYLNQLEKKIKHFVVLQTDSLVHTVCAMRCLSNILSFHTLLYVIVKSVTRTLRVLLEQFLEQIVLYLHVENKTCIIFH